MTRRFDLYGWAGGWAGSSLVEAAGRVGALLGVVLDPHDSSYRGGAYYLWRGDGGAEVIVQRNVPDEEGFLVEDAHPDHRILVYASRLPPAWFDELATLDDLVPLRSELQ